MTARQFRVDRGGTSTDIVARRRDGRLLTHEFRSDAAQPPYVRPLFTQSEDGLAHRRIAAYGLAGGAARSGDVLVIETPGGGGYGPPPRDNHPAGEETDDPRAH